MTQPASFHDLLAWFISSGANDEHEIRRRLREIPAGVWPAFSAEAASELHQVALETAPAPASGGGESLITMKRRLLGGERRHREP